MKRNEYSAPFELAIGYLTGIGKKKGAKMPIAPFPKAEQET
jgi:hypothetical protein